MVLPVGVLCMALLLVYAGGHNISVTDALRSLLGRAPTGKLGSLSGAPTVSNSSTGGGAGTGDGSRNAVLAAAQSALGYRSGYSETRPMPANLKDLATQPTDCSGFATLCYKAAGAPDPNGLGYDREGYTGTLESHGQRTGSPQPGDLVFWHSPDHVAIYGGGDTIYQLGGPPGPIKSSLQGEHAYHQSYLGARTYLGGNTTVPSNPRSVSPQQAINTGKIQQLLNRG